MTFKSQNHENKKESSSFCSLIFLHFCGAAHTNILCYNLRTGGRTTVLGSLTRRRVCISTDGLLASKMCAPPFILWPKYAWKCFQLSIFWNFWIIYEFVSLTFLKWSIEFFFIKIWLYCVYVLRFRHKKIFYATLFSWFYHIVIPPTK